MSFKNYLKKQKENLELPGIVFTFMRANPITTGHEENIKYVSELAKKKKADSRIFVSFVQNAKKNPLSSQDKIYYIKKILPNKTDLNENQSLNTPFKILEDLIKQGYKRIYFVVGKDRIHDFDAMKKYTKQWSNDATLEILSSGSRTKGVSGTEMRNLVKENKYKEFIEILPKKLKKFAEEIFNKVQTGLGL